MPSSEALLRRTKHIAKDGGPFTDPVKQQRCTTEPVGPLDGINKDVCGTKLHPVLAYPMDCDRWCHLLGTHHCCMSPNGTLNPPLASHPPLPPSHPLIRAIHDITVAEKAAQNPAVLDS